MSHMKTLWEKLVAISGWEAYKAAMKHRFKPDPVDARQFNDPVALGVSWSPIKPEGLLFPRRFRRRSGGRYGFYLRRLFVLAMLLWPLVITAAFYKVWFIVLLWMGISYPLVLGLLFVARPPVYVDKGMVWKGRGRRKTRIPVTDIHALQLLSFFYQNGHPRTAGVVYQLNLVWRDHRRVELVTQRMPPFQASRDALIGDANRLAWHLGVPLWDAINPHDR